MNLKRNEFLTLYQMVIADGVVHPKELETIYSIGKNAIGLTEEEMNNFVQNAGTVAPQPVLPEEKFSTLYRLALVAWADGVLDESERLLLKRYALLYGVDERRVDDLVSILLDEAEKGAEEKDVLNLLEKEG